MQTTAELEVLEILQRTARAIRRGVRPDLAVPAAEWEQQFSEQISRLQKDDKGEESQDGGIATH